MRLTETKMCNALLSGKDYRKDNTVVITRTDGAGIYHSAKVLLFESEIAHYYYHNGEGQWVIRITDAGWDTVTTRSRINALMRKVVQGDRVTLYRSKKETFYTMGANNYKWDGTHTFIAHEPEGWRR